MDTSCNDSLILPFVNFLGLANVTKTFCVIFEVSLLKLDYDDIAVYPLPQ